MDFFEAQDRAKKRTSRLVFMFVLAVLGTIVAGYFAAWFITGFLTEQPPASSSRFYESYATGPMDRSLWNPTLLAGVSIATVAVVGLASLFKWFSFRAGGSAVATSVGGRLVNPGSTDPKENRLLNVVEEMAIASGVPMPAVYILENEAGINAFAAGLTTSDAVVAVTRGTLDTLSRDELQGVIGHEFSHILNGDMKLNVKLTALIFGILVIGLIGRGVLWSMRYSRPRSGNNKNSGGILAVIIAIGIALFAIGYIGYFFGRLIQAAISRQREFLADASAVQFTRNPAGIAGALKKIGSVSQGAALTAKKSTELGHFFFAQGFKSNFGGLWATHPPLAERIRAIDSQFDGTFTSPETRPAYTPPPLPTKANPAPAAIPPPLANVIAAIGTLTTESVGNAQHLLAGIPALLREAARSETQAPALIYGLITNPATATQRKILTDHTGAETIAVFDQLAPALASLKPEHKLPLVQLAQPALQKLTAGQQDAFLKTLDQLIAADGVVSSFEFALKKVLSHGLALNRTPTDAKSRIFSFEAVAREINLLLSTLARAASVDEEAAARAFALGAETLKPLQGKLALLSSADCETEALGAALDQLAFTSGPIKQRLLIAGSTIICADGNVTSVEHDLLRAFATTLDCPMPPLSAA